MALTANSHAVVSCHQAKNDSGRAWLAMSVQIGFVIVCLIWGFAVVADSAQFSACVSELCRPDYIGAALTLQTSLGFLLALSRIKGTRRRLRRINRLELGGPEARI
jgi:hypothetical protein